MPRIARIGLISAGVLAALVIGRAVLDRYSGNGSVYHPARVHGFPDELGARGTNGSGQPVPLSDSISIRVAAISGLDAMVTANLRVTNGSAATISEITARCDALSAEGAVTSHVAVSLEGPFRPHATRTDSAVALHFIHRPERVQCVTASAAAALDSSTRVIR